MANGTFVSTAWTGPQKLQELMVQSETRVRMGTDYLYGSLETSSSAYTAAYGYASVGLKAGNSFDLGLVASLGLEITNEKEKFEAANVLDSGINLMTGESAVLSVGVVQFDPRVLQMCLSNGVMYEVGTSARERLFTVGAAAGSVTRPIELAATNIFTGAPGTPVDTESGISAIIVTFYDMECTSGLPWGDIVANSIHTLELEFTARSVSERAAGNRMLSVYIF